MRDRRGENKRAVRDDEGAALARAAVTSVLDSEINAALALHRMNENCAFVYEGGSSSAHLGATFGLDMPRARILADAGEAFVLAPVLLDRVRRRELRIESAAALFRILSHPKLAKEQEKWFKQAEITLPQKLLREIRRRIAEEEAREEPIEPLTLDFKAGQRDKLSRARDVISRKADIGRSISLEDTVEFLSDFFLDQEDEARLRPGKRRMGNTEGDPGRTVPASEKRKLRRRGRTCQVPNCSNHMFLYRCHIEPHGSGAGREASNLLTLCWLHHFALDKGHITFEGTAENPVFRNIRGEIIAGGPEP